MLSGSLSQGWRRGSGLRAVDEKLKLYKWIRTQGGDGGKERKQKDHLKRNDFRVLFFPLESKKINKSSDV